MPRISRLTLSITAIGLAFYAGSATAQDFHGFDPASYDGTMLSVDQLKAMVEDAKKVKPPRNGENYVIGFANLQRDMTFGVLVEKGIAANAEAAGIQLEIADNRLDGPTALANAQSFVQRNADYVIEFQTDINFGQSVMNVFDQDGVEVTAIDIPMPGSLFFGANNPKSGFIGGSYLAEAAIAKFGLDEVKKGYFVLGELPQSGAVLNMRSEGQLAGFLSQVEGFPEDHIIRIDTKNTLQEAFSQMSNALGRIPEGVPILIASINDQSTLGMIRAAKQAGYDANVLAVGNGADELKSLTEESAMLGSVAYFPERYGNYLLPIAFSALAGKQLPPAVLVKHVMITKDNICKVYSEYTCAGEAGFEYEFPQAAFEAHIDSLAGKDSLKGYESLIQKN